MTSTNKQAILLYASADLSATLHDSDMRYIAQCHAPDPFIACVVDGRSLAVVSKLEFTRMKGESAFDELLPLEELVNEAQLVFGTERPGVVELVHLLKKQRRIDSFLVGKHCPVFLCEGLRAHGIAFEIAEGELFPARIYKDADEAECIREGNNAAAAGIARAEAVLGESSICKDGTLEWRGRVLTSELLRQEANIAVLKAGAVGLNTITAGGAQAADPHCGGSGVLRANELIIVDIFPEVQTHGYHGDMTRTFLKGTPTDEQRHMHETVQVAHELAMEVAQQGHGVDAKAIDAAARKYIEKAGYKTECIDGVNVGFFHGTGHGLGLDIHEYPRVNPQGGILEEGMVITIEPGLYYPEIGGSRIEDVIWLKKDGFEILSNYHYRWIID